MSAGVNEGDKMTKNANVSDGATDVHGDVHFGDVRRVFYFAVVMNVDAKDKAIVKMRTRCVTMGMLRSIVNGNVLGSKLWQWLMNGERAVGVVMFPVINSPAYKKT